LHESRTTPRALRKSALFVFVLLLAARTVAAADAETARVVRAYDGDSVWLTDGREVRLIGVNTPELGRDGTPDQPLAETARARTDTLVRGRTVRLVYDAERFDHYGRTLAYVVLADGRDLQRLLIREGLGWFIAVSPNVARLDDYRSAETEARAAGRGIWSRPEYEPIPAERLTHRDTGFRRIIGTVWRVNDHGDWALLRLTRRFALTMSHRHDTPSPTSFAGKRILARGWVTEYKNRLRMRVTDPAMLQTLP
jgi:micrococcal nuclease